MPCPFEERDCTQVVGIRIAYGIGQRRLCALQKLVSERDQGPLCTDCCKLASGCDYVSPKELAAAYKRSNAHADALTGQYDSAHSTEALLTAPYGRVSVAGAEGAVLARAVRA